jgi:hypothetical protein
MPASGTVAFTTSLEMVEPRTHRRGLVVPAAVVVLLSPEGPPGRRVAVRGEVNGASFRSTLAAAADGSYVLTLNASVRKQAKLELGGTARLMLAPDLEPSVVDLPVDLAVALRASPRAAEAFGRLGPSHQREYVEWLGQAKKRETRTRRMEKMLNDLAKDKQEPEADPPAHGR